MSLWFVAGAGTDIGKTYVTACLVRGLRARGKEALALKPVVSGVPPLSDPAFADSDTALLLKAQGHAVDAVAVEACSPWRFTAPLSPDMAAAAEGRSLVLADVLAWLRPQAEANRQGAVILIEGVGGVMSPLTNDALNIDAVQALDCPVILVGGSYLGSISHTLTALETLRARGVAVRALVLNETAGSTVDFEATLQSLRRFAGAVEITPLHRDERTLNLSLDENACFGSARHQDGERSDQG